MQSSVELRSWRRQTAFSYANSGCQRFAEFYDRFDRAIEVSDGVSIHDVLIPDFVGEPGESLFCGHAPDDSGL